MQNHVSRMVRVFKKEGGVEQGNTDETEVYLEGLDSVLVLGKDQTRGEYKVKGVGTVQGGKVVMGRKFEERVLRTIHEGDRGGESWLRKEPSEKHSKWVITQGRKWLSNAKLMARGQTKEKGKCQECGADSSVHHRKIELCTRCNRKVFSWEHMRKVEGFMLLSWIIVECRGREWMNQMFLNKKKVARMGKVVASKYSMRKMGGVVDGGGKCCDGYGRRGRGPGGTGGSGTMGASTFIVGKLLDNKYG